MCGERTTFDGGADNLPRSAHPRAPEDGGEEWAVAMLPRNHVARFEPWDPGEYDT
jgi:hypothetical protein